MKKGVREREERENERREVVTRRENLTCHNSGGVVQTEAP